MKFRLVFVIGAMLLAAGAGWSQQSLGEVAGSIKLNPEAIVQKEGFVEDPRIAQREDHELFKTVLEESSASADSLASVIDEARANRVFDNREMSARLSAASLDLDTRLSELDLLRLGDVFAAAEVTAWGAVEICNAATDAVREEIARKGVAFSRAKEEVALCRNELHRAEAQLAVVGRTEAGDLREPADSGGEVGNSADAAIVGAACDAARRQGEAAFEACEDRQYRALAAIETRTPGNEFLEAAVFSEIRRICTELNPADFERRNLCEIERMTATRIESE